MKIAFVRIGIVLVLLFVVLLGYGLSGFFAAREEAGALARKADELIRDQRGPRDLGRGRTEQLLLVEDPNFWNHDGVDLSTSGAGLTTLTQSLSKRVGFTSFKPGIRKVRLMGYAVGLESKLSKEQILALYLDTVWMGRGPQGPMAGFFDASEAIYGREPASLSQREFLTLVAVPIAPRTFNLMQPNHQMLDRVQRIERLVERECHPTGLRDVWLNGCS